MMKLFNIIMLIALFLLPKIVQSQENIAYCRLIENVLGHSVFQNMPFSLVDTIYVYESEDKYFSSCDLFSDTCAKFRYSWNSSEKDWISIDSNDAKLLSDKKVLIRTTDTGVVYRTSLNLAISVKQGKQSMEAVGDKSLHKIRYCILSYKKYVSVWIVWRLNHESSVNHVICMTYKKKKNDYVLVSYGMS